MKLKWFGQSCFMITSENGVIIITDPFGKLPYRLPTTKPDIVTVSHEHGDHNNIKALKGHFLTFNKPIETEVDGIKIKGLETFHDNAGGKKRGKNIVFIITVDEISICHLGDLGHVLTEDQIREIGRVDILLLPVGGRVTIGADEAAIVKSQLQPVITVPMHYRTKALGPFGLILGRVDDFLKLITDAKMEMDEILVSKENLLQNNGVITLAYQK